MTKVKELDMLENYLKTKGISYTRTYDGGHQIIVFDSYGHRQWDVVCRPGSYGYEEGLLEAMGDPVVTWKDGDSVVGFLTAQDVIKRLEGNE